jgi:ParB-like chromosome segregation protein Spo0J
MVILQVAEEADQNNRSSVRIVEISLLRGHERLDTQRLYNLKAEIESDGILKRPIAVDVNTNVVLDGHHRIGALRLLGCSKIPVLFVDYNSPKIGVKTAENGEEYPKQKVIEAALKGKQLPPKSTWHYVTFSKKIAHISKIQKRVDVPLRDLK